MNVFKDNTLVNFKILLSEEINLQGEWKEAVTEITFPTQINNVTVLQKRSGYSKHERWER